MSICHSTTPVPSTEPRTEEGQTAKMNLAVPTQHQTNLKPQNARGT